MFQPTEVEDVLVEAIDDDTKLDAEPDLPYSKPQFPALTPKLGQNVAPISAGPPEKHELNMTERFCCEAQEGTGGKEADAPHCGASAQESFSVEHPWIT